MKTQFVSLAQQSEFDTVVIYAPIELLLLKNKKTSKNKFLLIIEILSKGHLQSKFD